MLKVIDRYIIKELASGVLFISGVIAIVIVTTKIGEVVRITTYTQRPILILNLIALIVSVNLNLIVPIAFLSSVTGTFMRLSADSEIIGINSLGIPTKRLLRITLLLATVTFAIMTLVNFYLIPLANRSLEGLYIYATVKKRNLGIEPYRFSELGKNIVVYAAEVSDNILKNLVIINRKDKKISNVIYAREGKLSASEEGTVKFKLSNGNMLIKNKNSINIVDFSNYNIEISADLTSKFREVTRKESTINQLLDKLKMENNKGKRNEILVHIYKRVALAFSPIVFTLVALPISIHFHRREKRWSIIVTALIAFIYFSLLSFSQKTLVKMDLPFLGAWLPNVILSVIGIILTRQKLDRSYL